MSPTCDHYPKETCQAISYPGAVGCVLCFSRSSDLIKSSRLELSRIIGNEPALVGLIRVYKEYYPDVIVGDAAAGRASHFDVRNFCSMERYIATANLPQHPNTEWRERLHVIHASNLSKDETLPETASFKVVRRGAKRSRVSLVPEVQTSRADEVR